MPLEVLVRAVLGRLGRKHGLLYSGSAHTFHLSGLHVQPTSYVGRRSPLTSPKGRPKRPSPLAIFVASAARRVQRGQSLALEQPLRTLTLFTNVLVLTPPSRPNERMYHLWRRESLELANRIARQMHGASADTKQLAQASFASFVRKMTRRCFAPLDRDFHLSRAGLRKVEQIGDDAILVLRDSLSAAPSDTSAQSAV